MPNWCSEMVTFTQDDGGTDRLELLANDLKRICEANQKVTKEALMTRGWPETAANRYIDSSPDWIGRLILELGIDVHSDDKHIEAFYFRGFVQGFDLSQGQLQIQMESAWGPCVSAWYMICDYYDLTFVLYAEEPGCEVYINTDQSREIYPEVMKVFWRNGKEGIYDEIDDASTPQEILEWLEEEEYANPIEDLIGKDIGNLVRHELTVNDIFSKLTIDDLLNRYESYLEIWTFEDLDEQAFMEYQNTCQNLYGQPSLPVKWTDR